MVRLRLGRVYRFQGASFWALSQFGPRTTFRFLTTSADGTTRTEKEIENEIAVEQLRFRPSSRVTCLPTQLLERG